MAEQRRMTHTSMQHVQQASGLVVKFVRGLMSARWMCERFPIRHAYIIIRNPIDTVSSQLCVGAARETPTKGFAAFRAAYPEVSFPDPKTDAEVLATWWACSYYAALSAPQPHPWTLLRYEDLVQNADRALEAIFKPLGVEAPSAAREFWSTPSRTSRPWSAPNQPSGHSAHSLSSKDRAAVLSVVLRFGLFEDVYPEVR